jgi:hypothetical protein
MKALRLLPLAVALLFFASWGDWPPDGSISTPQGAIFGSFTLDPYVRGTVEDVSVQLCMRWEDVPMARPVRNVRTDIRGDHVLESDCCGQYFVVARKDNNTDKVLDSGDFYSSPTVECSACRVTIGGPATVCGTLSVVQ